MKQNTLAKIQIIVAIVVAIYVVMPDLFVGPIDDSAILLITSIVEVVLQVMKKLPSSVTDTDSNNYSNNYYDNTF